MDINANIQLNGDNKLIHFLNIEGLNKNHILEIVSKADDFSLETKKKFNVLEGKTVASLFFEPST